MTIKRLGLKYATYHRKSTCRDSIGMGLDIWDEVWLSSSPLLGLGKVGNLFSSRARRTTSFKCLVAKFLKIGVNPVKTADSAKCHQCNSSRRCPRCAGN